MERGDNGGFPEPVAGEPIRLVRCRHEACGAATRLRLPRDVPANAVRRVVCQGCREPFQADQVLDVGVIGTRPVEILREPGTLVPAPSSRRDAPRLPRTRVPGWLSNPQSRAWRYLSVPIAAALVIGALLLIQGSGEPARHSASSTAPAAPGPTANTSDTAQVVKGSRYTVALPPAWKRTNPRGGATFAAAPIDGGADATLWIEKAPQLSFHAFEARSLGQLRGLAGSAHVVNRVAAPTPEGTVVTLAADNPEGQPSYEVTLRTSGPYRYYLATSVDPNASREAADGAELIHNSFVPTTTGGNSR